jgi:HD-like signal output (HDOD) protein/GGDEF domain-containing protein
MRLPLPPAGLAIVLRAADDTDAPLTRLSALVEKEPSLTVHVLKMSNSAAFGVGRPVRSVAQATILLGTRAVRNMAVTQLMQVMVTRVDGGRFDVDSFWEHSLRRASAALALAEMAGYEEASEAFSAGLIQDLGLLVMAVMRPDLALDLTAAMAAPLEVQLVRERQLFGETHAELFARVGPIWGVPGDLVQAIALHHEIGDAGEEVPRRVARLAELLRVGDLVADTMATAPTFMRLAHLQEALAALRTRMPLEPEALFTRVGAAMKEMASALGVKTGATPTWEELVTAAHRLLDRITSEYEERTRRLESELRERDRQLITRRQRRAEKGQVTLERHEFVKRLERFMETARAETGQVSIVLFLVQKTAGLDGVGADEWLESAVAATRERLAQAVREDDVVLRIGNDEIVAVLPGCSRADGPPVAMRLVSRLTREFLTIEGRAPMRVGLVCTGTSLDADDELTAEELMRRAEVMRFQARSERLDGVSWWG